MAEGIHDLHTFMEQASSEMASEYARIFARATEDPGTAGDEGEGNWAVFLRSWLPAGYHVETKGRLIGSDGRMSKQIDIVVLKPSYPPKLLDKKVWLAGGVAAVFECKTTLTAGHVYASVERCAEFKTLFDKRIGSPRKELISPLIYGLLAHSHSWKGGNSTPVPNIERAYGVSAAAIREPRLGLDVICVSDLATWSSFYTSRYDASWKPQERTALEAVFGAPCGPMTALLCNAIGSESQSPNFRPVGALISSLSQRLAWEDYALRDIADYYRKANLSGTGLGMMRPWPLSIYSSEVRDRVLLGALTNGINWDDWSMGGP